MADFYESFLQFVVVILLFVWKGARERRVRREERGKRKHMFLFL
jgi:hypothetical protein